MENINRLGGEVFASLLSLPFGLSPLTMEPLVLRVKHLKRPPNHIVRVLISSRSHSLSNQLLMFWLDGDGHFVSSYWRRGGDSNPR